MHLNSGMYGKSLLSPFLDLDIVDSRRCADYFIVNSDWLSKLLLRKVEPARNMTCSIRVLLKYGKMI